MNANVEFDEIRPYHDEELPQVYEELIADAAFRQAVDTVMPGVPFEVWSQKMRACKTKLEFQKTFCYGLLWKLAKEATDGLTLDHTALPADKCRSSCLQIVCIWQNGFLSGFRVRRNVRR